RRYRRRLPAVVACRPLGDHPELAPRLGSAGRSAVAALRAVGGAGHRVLHGVALQASALRLAGLSRAGPPGGTFVGGHHDRRTPSGRLVGGSPPAPRLPARCAPALCGPRPPGFSPWPPPAPRPSGPVGWAFPAASWRPST